MSPGDGARVLKFASNPLFTFDRVLTPLAKAGLRTRFHPPKTDSEPFLAIAPTTVGITATLPTTLQITLRVFILISVIINNSIKVLLPWWGPIEWRENLQRCSFTPLKVLDNVLMRWFVSSLYEPYVPTCECKGHVSIGVEEVRYYGAN